MKKKTYKDLKLNELLYNKKHSIELNKKLKIPRIINSNTNINNINLYGEKTEIINNKTNKLIRS